MNATIEIRKPPMCAMMPSWPGARMAVRLAVAAKSEHPLMAVAHAFPDRSYLSLEYQLERRDDVPESVYGNVGEPPLLSMVVIDYGAGIVGGQFAQEHDAERALREIVTFLGADKPKALFGESINPRRSRRQYWMQVMA